MSNMSKPSVYDVVEGILDEVYELTVNRMQEEGIDVDSVTRIGCIAYNDRDRRETYVVDFNQQKCPVYEGKEMLKQKVKE